MSNSLVKLYAQSLVEVISDSDLEGFKEELLLLCKVLSEMHFVIKMCQYDKALQEQFLKGLSNTKVFRKELINLIKLLAKNLRLPLANEVVTQAVSMVNARLNIREISIIIPHKLEEKKRLDLENKLSKNLGVNLQASYIINPEIIGGIKIILDGKEFDATILGKINAFRHSVFAGIDQIK